MRFQVSYEIPKVSPEIGIDHLLPQGGVQARIRESVACFAYLYLSPEIGRAPPSVTIPTPPLGGSPAVAPA